MQAVRLVGALAGALLVLATSGSVLASLVVPGARAGRMMRMVDSLTSRIFRFVCRPLPGYRQRHRVLAYHGPVMLATLLAFWLAAYLVGFGLLLWPAVHGLGSALREAGSSLLTLGFASTVRGEPTTVDFVAGATGLIVVALQIAYLPTLYASFNRRETEVTLIAVRAGLPAWGPELLARSRFMITTDELPDFYRQWERWAADVAESHSSYPILLRFRSPDPDSSWLIALLAVMDSAALYSALAPGRVPVHARLCLRMGFSCLQQLATTIGLPFDQDPRPDAGTALTREEFDQGIARLEAVGFAMERTPDEAWPHFQGWRVNYESIAYRLALAIDAVPALWSGPRRSGEAPFGPRMAVNRTPEDPEGTRPPRASWSRRPGE
jgi:hypothetical protein